MDDPFRNLILSYEKAADQRDRSEASDWKIDLRWKYLAALQAEGRSTLIDLGAGTGLHGKFFQDQGLQVVCVDLVPAHVEKCREKGLESYRLDFLDLAGFERRFDAAFALNTLLHIPTKLLPVALANLATLLEPGGLMYWGQYGGEYSEGIYEEDHQEPKRFFSLLDDQQILGFAAGHFTVEEFERIDLEGSSPLHFQSLLLRAKT